MVFYFLQLSWRKFLSLDSATVCPYHDAVWFLTAIHDWLSILCLYFIVLIWLLQYKTTPNEQAKNECRLYAF